MSRVTSSSARVAPVALRQATHGDSHVFSVLVQEEGAGGRRLSPRPPAGRSTAQFGDVAREIRIVDGDDGHGQIDAGVGLALAEGDRGCR
ncbi:hypothetical protein HR12_44110 [Microbacterium sp. SUBG005]|nr:hypothetical protein HR12_44110 [Microbacterium sp. SUBG005]